MRYEVQTLENTNYADYGEKKVTKGLQHGVWRIVEHGSHREAGSDAVRRAFLYDGRFIGFRIIYVIFLIVVIT